ncbi:MULTISPECIES: Hsp20/alpha crystallin family protein [unclassified Corynebacterium]|uniref:Hsp20/alpha crystallin family protein n=1 Tax=unclassified Corynebacterium TaxID=2624378 RepID=UPI0030A17EC7
MADISRWDPFAELNALQKAFFGDNPSTPARAVNIPTTDVYTRDGAIVVEAHLPSFKKEDIDLDVDGRTLTISASRHEVTKDTDKKYVIRESASNFQRRVTLPEGTDTEKIEANLTDGVLVITIPTPEAKSSKKKIAITSNAQPEAIEAAEGEGENKESEVVDS